MKTVPKRNQLALCLLTACLIAAATAVDAQGYPTRPIRLVVPTSPGGGTDLAARRLAPKLGEFIGQPVVVENRAGGGTMIGMESVARAAPDGYTVAMGISSLTMAPYTHIKVPYDPAKDFAPVSQVLVLPNILVANSSVPARSLKELIAYVKARPGEINFAAGGAGSNAHLSMELLMLQTGMKMVLIPYKGQGPAMTDVLAGHVPLLMADFLSALPRIRAGTLRAYGVTSAKRASVAPDVPTLAEAGVPGYEVVQWFGILAPTKTPREIIAKLHAATVNALKDPATREGFVKDGAEPVGSTPEEFAAVIREDLKKWAKVTKDAGIKPQ
ncbi:MAG: tripartite tricarboxylate transporter substrate binding protein [Betaproteobacteria bacterium]|nr:tripartite tricarboxylate transporter substrate binding protein [Betaproteobacteria bacterium]